MSGDRSDELLAELYGELHSLSQGYLRGERGDHTLQATALVHEAWVRLADVDHWNDREHFFRTAARAMRRVLIDHAHQYRAAKRGGGERPVSIDEVTSLLAVDQEVDVLVLDEALAELEALDEPKARIVELRFFAGCTIDETARALSISTASVERGWRFARAWLRARLEDDGTTGSGATGSGAAGPGAAGPGAAGRGESDRSGDGRPPGRDRR